MRAGRCVAALPCMTGDAAGLRRCFDLPDGGAPLWLVYHERLRGRPHARAFLDALLARVEEMGPQLNGSGQNIPIASGEADERVSTSPDTNGTG